jgi:hypothetical protein
MGVGAKALIKVLIKVSIKVDFNADIRVIAIMAVAVLALIKDMVLKASIKGMDQSIIRKIGFSGRGIKEDIECH